MKFRKDPPLTLLALVTVLICFREFKVSSNISIPLRGIGKRKGASRGDAVLPDEVSIPLRGIGKQKG